MPYFDPGNGELVFIPNSDWNRGTYRELLAILSELPDEQLDQEATVLDRSNDEFVTVQSIGWSGPAAKIGQNHFYLSI